MCQYVPCRANMWQHCSLSAVQKKTKLLPDSSLAFDPANLFRLACTKRCICIYQCFLLWWSKQRPRFANGQHGLLWNEGTCLEQLELFFFQRMKGEEGWVCWVQCGYMWQHCRLWAMQRTELFPDSILFSTWFLQVCLLKLSHGNKQRQTSVLFSGFESKRQDSPKLSPKAIFQRKKHDRATDSSARMSEPRTRLSMLCSMRVHVATLAFVSYAKKDKALSRQHPCSRDDLFRFA